jgi:uncharacterized protein YgiM (DUF1202 family)
MSKKHRNNEVPVTETIVKTVVTEDAVETIETEINTVETVEVEPEVVEPKTIDGFVSGCNLLNVRKAPKSTADIVCAIDANSTVVIHEDDSTDEYYKVCTASGFEGFCMKKYISVAAKQ